MPSFNSIADLEKYLKEKVIPNILKNEIKNVVVETELKHIKSDVYDVYTPKVYPNIEQDIHRRGADGGMLDPKNIKHTLISNDTLSVTNETPPNPYARDGATVNKNLPELIEFGDSYNGNEYDYTDDPDAKYLQPRSFTANTIEDLKNSDKLINALHDGLKRNKIESV